MELTSIILVALMLTLTLALALVVAVEVADLLKQIKKTIEIKIEYDYLLSILKFLEK